MVGMQPEEQPVIRTDPLPHHIGHCLSRNAPTNAAGSPAASRPIMIIAARATWRGKTASA
jgi:hypothetical protein